MLILRAPYLVFSAVACQVLGVFLIDPAGIVDPLRRVLIMAGFPLAIAFVWMNRRSLGLQILGLGLVLNLAVMTTNGGLMPVTAEAVAQAGMSHRIAGVEAGNAIPGTKNVLMEQGSARLEMLSDVIVLSHRLSGMRIVSAGDVVVAFGLLSVVVSLSMRSLGEWRGRKAPMDLMVRRYRTGAEFEREASVLEGENWEAVSIVEEPGRARRPRAPVLRFVARFWRPKPRVGVTYRRNRSRPIS